jgi:hypothetical protein
LIVFRFDRQTSSVRVVLVGRDRHFLHVAGAFIEQSGYHVSATDRPCELIETINRVGATVVVVDGSDYLATAVPSMSAMNDTQKPVGIVTVAEARALSPLTNPGVLPKWGSFMRLIREIERAHNERPAALQASLV